MRIVVQAPVNIAEGLAEAAVQTSGQNREPDTRPGGALVRVDGTPRLAPAETVNPLAKRDPTTGRLLPGQSLNPGGRKGGLKSIMAEVVDFRAVIAMVADIAYGKLAPAARMNDRLKAAELLLSYQYGKPTQNVNLTDDNKTPSNVKVMSNEQLSALRTRLSRMLTDVTDAEIVED